MEGDTVLLAAGTYSPLTNSEVFPIEMASGIHLIGSGEDVSIIDAQHTNRVITMEECGELTQACSKVLRTNFKDHALEDLRKEVADVMCMVDLMREQGLIDDFDIMQGIKNKREKLEIWSNLIK